jgi:transcriptional regulator with XRE-family HTH domain
MSKMAREFRNARTSRGLLLADVAAGTGLSVSYISDIERGRTAPSLHTLGTLERFYGIPETTFEDVRDNERYITVLRSDWERMRALAADLTALIAKYDDTEAAS